MKKNKHCIKSWNQIQTPWIKIHYLSELEQFIALLETYEIERKPPNSSAWYFNYQCFTIHLKKRDFSDFACLLICFFSVLKSIVARLLQFPLAPGNYILDHQGQILPLPALINSNFFLQTSLSLYSAISGCNLKL